MPGPSAPSRELYHETRATLTEIETELNKYVENEAYSPAQATLMLAKVNCLLTLATLQANQPINVTVQAPRR